MVAGAQITMGSVQRLWRRNKARAMGEGGWGRFRLGARGGGPWEVACALHRRGTGSIGSMQAQEQVGSWNKGPNQCIRLGTVCCVSPLFLLSVENMP